MGLVLALGAVGCVPAYQLVRTPRVRLADYGKLVVLKVDNGDFLDGVGSDRAYAKEKRVLDSMAGEIEGSLLDWADGWTGGDPRKVLKLRLRLLDHQVAHDFLVYSQVGRLRYRVSLLDGGKVVGEATVEQSFGVAGFGNEDGDETVTRAVAGKVIQFVRDFRGDAAAGEEAQAPADLRRN